MNPLQQTLLLYLVPGLLLGLGLASLAGWIKNFWWSVPLFFIAVILLWASLAIGVHEGYGAWQSMPNPPDEAFADGANLIGSLMFGWLPSGLLCTAAFLITKLVATGVRKRGAS